MDSISTVIHGVEYTKLHVSEFEKFPEMYLFYYDYIKNTPYEVVEGVEGYKGYIDKLKESEYALIVATSREEFLGAAYCTYEKFTDYVFIKQYVTAPGAQPDIKSIANAIWYFEIKEEKPTKGVMSFPLSGLKSFKFTAV